MKHSFFMLIVTMGLAVGGGAALATADGPDYFAVKGVAANDVLNIRAEPSAGSARIGEIPPDARGIRNLGCQGGPTFAEWQAMTESERVRAAHDRWCRVRYGGVEGWVAGRFLTEDSAAAAAPGGGASVPAAPEDGGPRLWQVTGVTSALNLRQEPSRAAPIIARYAPGTLLTNLGCRRAEGRAWCDVQELGGGPGGYVAAEFLSSAVSPDGGVATGPDDSALRAGQGDFDATGMFPCAHRAGQPMQQCTFGVARAGGGFATVVVTKPDGVTRALFFTNGRFLSADTSQADGYPEYSGRKEADLHLIRVGSERYEIPDAVIFGG